ncbi:MAG: hypothetical protein V4631_21990 [Pseudomonadota bacterium]
MTMKTAAKERAGRMEKLARDAIKQYNDDMAKGGDPVFPDWSLELLGLLADYDRLLATMANQRLQPVNVVDFETGKCSASIVQRVPS